MRWGTNGTRQNALSNGNRAATIVASSEHESAAGSNDHLTDRSGPINESESGLQLSSPVNYGTPSSLGSIRTPRSGIRGTPIRHRPDINTDRHLRQFTLQEPVRKRIINRVLILLLFYYDITSIIIDSRSSKCCKNIRK